MIYKLKEENLNHFLNKWSSIPERHDNIFSLPDDWLLLKDSNHGLEHGDHLCVFKENLKKPLSGEEYNDKVYYIVVEHDDFFIGLVKDDHFMKDDV